VYPHVTGVGHDVGVLALEDGGGLLDQSPRRLDYAHGDIGRGIAGVGIDLLDYGHI
jgi:hypothetical protein